MDSSWFWIALFASPLAVWRLADMLSDIQEVGPFNILAKLRYLAGLRFDEHSFPTTKPGSLADGLTCIYCNSVWIGVIFALLLWFVPLVAFMVIVPLALSGCAVLINGWFNDDAP